jgi:hypothetical protein
MGRARRELKADSDAIVRVRATGKAEVVTITGMPFTITDVKVTEVIQGGVPDVIRIRQTGVEGTVGAVGAEILKAGASYLLFLDKFELSGEDVTNQYVVVGVEAGLYLEEPGQARLLDSESPDLPAALPVDDLKAQIRGQG